MTLQNTPEIQERAELENNTIDLLSAAPSWKSLQEIAMEIWELSEANLQKIDFCLNFKGTLDTRTRYRADVVSTTSESIKSLLDQADAHNEAERERIIDELIQKIRANQSLGCVLMSILEDLPTEEDMKRVMTEKLNLPAAQYLVKFVDRIQD